MLNFITLLAPSLTMPGESGETVTEAVTQAAQTVAEAAGEATTQAATLFGINLGKGGSTIIMVIYILALVLVFYFFAIRPQKKKAAALKEIQDGIKVGDEIMTSSGFYGKVVDIESDEVAVVEFGTNRGVRIPVNKSEIIGNKSVSAKAETEKK